MNFIRRLFASLLPTKHHPSEKIEKSSSEKTFRRSETSSLQGGVPPVEVADDADGGNNLPVFCLDRSRLSIENLEYVGPNEISKLARHNLSVVLKLFGNISQVELADRLGIHPSNISRLKSGGELERLSVILAACNIELPSSERQLYDVKFVDSLLVIASTNLKNLQS